MKSHTSKDYRRCSPDIAVGSASCSFECRCDGHGGTQRRKFTRVPRSSGPNIDVALDQKRHEASRVARLHATCFLNTPDCNSFYRGCFSDP